ncbi:MBL fold metallo-hydrolase [Bacillus sp. Marseille-P3661]|uniref:MBL fold metallo-hydrolase n=1 Tax=Bacillus sp. Marseille-P3661 TaxID=1936234 RepID=UPI000C825693|nr:MBL fold metallo-hydrolase [Bacillus sp. Marseille-P3661]
MIDYLGIERITINLPFRLNHVHCFLAEGENGWKVIDTGLHNESAVQAWKEHITNKKISDIIITHYHPDHFGYAGQLQRLTSANVWMTECDSILSRELWSSEASEKLTHLYKECGFSPETVGKLANVNPQIYPFPEITGYLDEGDQIKFGKFEYEIIYTPGHADGLFCLYNKEKSILLSTDHILPEITPNISLKFTGEKNPLGSYFASLAKIKALNVDFAVPSHGDPFYNVNQRIQEIEDHHIERLEKMLEIISTPKTAMEVCKEIFRRDLTLHELRFAIGETLSHLEYLIDQNKCKKEMINEIWYYCKN